jgi:hypothetical protein
MVLTDDVSKVQDSKSCGQAFDSNNLSDDHREDTDESTLRNKE